MKYNYFLDENNYITGWSLTTEGQGNGPDPLPEMNEIPLGIRDEFNNPKYQLIGGTFVLNPQSSTLEQKEAKRKGLIVAEIRKIYTQDDEFKMINLGISDPNNSEYLEYRDKVQEIKDQFPIESM